MLSPDQYIQNPYSLQSINRYSYALNNPLKYTDPTGEIIWPFHQAGEGSYLGDPGGGGDNSSGILLEEVVITVERLPKSDFSSLDYFSSSNPPLSLAMGRGGCPWCPIALHYNDSGGDPNRSNWDLTGMKVYDDISQVLLSYKNVSMNLLDNSDIFKTWEHIGYSNLKPHGNYLFGLARPMIIVSESVADTLKVCILLM